MHSEMSERNPHHEAATEEYRAKLVEKLERFGIRPDPDHKDQHFLVNPETISDLIEAAGIEEGDSVVEIGSGPGNITEEIAKRAGRAIAVEIDPRFQPILADLQREYPNIELIMGDYLTTATPEADKIISNPPFSILEPMLQRFTRERVEDIALVIGDRYAQRAIALPGSREFSKTSLFTQAYFQPEYVRRIDRDDFYPDTSERSAILKLVSHGRGADPVLQLIADMLIEAPERRVSSLIDAVCNEYGMPRGGKVTKDNYQEVISPSSLSLPPQLLEKRLMEIDNRELNALTTKLMGVRQRRLRGRNRRLRSYDDEDE